MLANARYVLNFMHYSNGVLAAPDADIKRWKDSNNLALTYAVVAKLMSRLLR